MILRKVRVSDGARDDIHHILEWTLQEFGVEQRETYAAAIARALIHLQICSSVSFHRHPHLKPEIKVFHLSVLQPRARHLFLIRCDNEHQIEVARILHDRMDVSRHVPKGWRWRFSE